MAFLAITVETMNDSGEGSLRPALDSAAALTADDTLSITFGASLSGQTLFLRSQLVLDGDARMVLDGDIDGDDAPDIVIAGGSDRNGVVVAADSRLFFVEDGVRVSIASVRFQDGVGLGDEAAGEQGGDEIDLLFDDAPPGLLGLSGNDRLASSAGVSLFGGKGRDSLTGSIGFDELNGGGGKDKIVFQSGASGFSDLKLRQKGDDVKIKYEGGAIIVEDADKDDFGGRDFLFA